MDFPTFQELFRIQRDEMLSRNGQLTREIIERQGSDTNLIAAGAAAVGDEVIAQLTALEAALFLESATGKALDRLVFSRFNMTRKPASPAVGSVNFTTTAAAPGGFTIPSGTRLSTSDGRQFATIADANFAMGSTGPVTVAIRSLLAGLSQQAASRTVNSITSQITGAPGDLVATNPLATSGADDAESDDSLRDRARAFWTNARRGTVGAIQSAAQAVLGVKTASAFEVLDQLGRPSKMVQLVVADAFTDSLVNVSPTPPTYQTQSQVLADAVFAALYDVRGAGIFVQVTVAQVTLQGVQLGLRFTAGADADATALAARAAVSAVINSLAPGQPLTNAAMIAALRAVPGLIVTGQEIVSPVGDVVPAPLEVLRSSLSMVLAVSLSPDRALQGSTNPDG